MSPQLGIAIAQVGLSQLINVFNTYQQEETSRDIVRTHYQAILEKVRMEQETLLHYYDLKFTERKHTLETFYCLLHQAVESGNNQHLQSALYGILEVIKTDPLADYDKFVQALENSETLSVISDVSGGSFAFLPPMRLSPLGIPVVHPGGLFEPFCALARRLSLWRY